MCVCVYGNCVNACVFVRVCYSSVFSLGQWRPRNREIQQHPLPDRTQFKRLAAIRHVCVLNLLVGSFLPCVFSHQDYSYHSCSSSPVGAIFQKHTRVIFFWPSMHTHTHIDPRIAREPASQPAHIRAHQHAEVLRWWWCNKHMHIPHKVYGFVHGYKVVELRCWYYSKTCVKIIIVL